MGTVLDESESTAADPYGASAVAQVASLPRPLWRRAIPIAVTAIIASAVTGISIWKLGPSTSPTVARFVFTLPEGQQFIRPIEHAGDVTGAGGPQLVRGAGAASPIE